MELILDEPRTQSEELVFLDKFKSDSSRSEDELKRRFDIGQDAVQIVTIHSSKGLEYEIVFALGLINRTPTTDLYYTHEGKIQFVFDPEDPRMISYQEELDAEKMRQLYVACTRAKYRLYLPYIKTKELDKIGVASPMELFVQGFNQPVERYIMSSSASYSLLNDISFALSYNDEESVPALVPPEKIQVSAVSLSVTSFSSLAQKHVSNLSEVPHAFDCDLMSSHTLPSGSETGTLLHTLLEEIPFSLGCEWVSSYDVAIHIEPYIKDTKYEKWGLVIAEIVFNAITTPFIKGAALKDLDPDCCKYEAEFLYPYTSDTYMKGFIDLIFEHKGKFYILDWKSNWLGMNFDCYTEFYLEDAMQNHEYHLQASIYVNSLKKYLKLMHDQSFSELFGGVYYVFLRGLPKHGVKYIEPSVYIS